MNRQEFEMLYSRTRKSKQSEQILHNNRRWTISRGDCQRLASDGCYDRIGVVALCLNSAGDARRRMKLKNACRSIISMARDMRINGVNS